MAKINSGSIASLLVLGALSLTLGGCEIIASVDRGQIPDTSLTGNAGIGGTGQGPGGSGGAGGTTSNGGSAGKGGSAGGGAGGKAGMSGAAGAPGGAAGMSGKAGMGGTGGAPGGAAGMSGMGGAPGGAAGMSGTAGMGGTGGSPGGSAGMSGTAGMSGASGTGGAPGGAAGTSGAGGSAGMGGGASGDGTLATTTKVSDGMTDGYVSPFDAAPSPDGTMIYFTAIDPSNGAGAVFSVKADGSAGAAKIFSGAPLVAPVGLAVSGDGKTLYVVDIGAAEDMTKSDIKLDGGAVFTMSTGGGAPMLVSGLQGKNIRSVSVVTGGSGDSLLVGASPGGVPGVYQTDPVGSAFTALMGAVVNDPSGISVSPDGKTVYVLDAANPGSRRAQVLAVTAGATSVLADGLYVGVPAGIAVSGDGTGLVIASLDPASRTDSATRLDVAAKTLTAQNTGLKNFVEASGLHRAASADVYGFVDGLGASGLGAVFALTK